MVAFLAPFFATVGAKAATFGITKAAIGQAVVGAAASAIMNKSADNRPQTTTTTSKSRTNFQEMRDDAIAAGYNPLTALRMTGAAGNVTTTGTSVINTPALSSRAILGRAIGAGLNSLGNSISSYDPLAQKQKELNIKLSEQQLSRGNLSTLPPGITPPGFKVAGSSFADRVAATPDEPNAYDPRSGWSIQVWDMADGTQPISEVTNIDGYLVANTIKPPLYPYATPLGNMAYLPWEEPGADEIVGGIANYGILSMLDAAKSASAPRLDIQEYLSKWKSGGYERLRTANGWAYQ